jgi:hypothetical protein
MIGGPWTREQKAAYRTAFSIGRIGDELWVLIALTWSVVCVVTLDYVDGVLYVIGVAASFAGLYWLTWQVLLPWLEQTMPDELRAALPRDRFAGPASSHAPRTYRELFRRWLAPTEASRR